MVSSKPKPKKGFSMSLSKPKSSSSSSSTSAAAAAKKGKGDRGSSNNSSSSITKPSSAIGAAHDDDDDDDDGRGAGEGGGKRDYVTGIGGGKVVTKEVVVERGPRVIALASNPWANGSSSNSTAAAGGLSAAPAAPASPPAATAEADGPAPEKSLDQLAAEAIARESRHGDGDRAANDGYGLGLDSDRVIGMVGKAGDNSNSEATAEGATASGGGGGGGSSKKRTGILEQNMIPGILDVDGEDAKFKHDLGHRAEDLTARSMAYVDVPVAEFGAALLRGMGWQGPEGDGGGSGGAGGAGGGPPNEIEPRHHRLGLGAQPKPPEEMKKPRKRKPGEKARSSDAERLQIWEKKVQEERSRASQQSSSAKQLSVMDVVELSEKGGERERGGGERRPRAMVLKTQGVPGLNKISVRMEDTGEKVIVDKSSATRVSEDDLARRPFSENKNKSSRSSKDTSNASSGDERNTRREQGDYDDDDDGDGGGGGSSRAENGRARRSRSRSSGRGESEERDDDEQDRRNGGKKSKSSKKDKKKHKKSSSSKRERERSGDGRGRSPSPRRSYDDDDDAGGGGGRDTSRRRPDRDGNRSGRPRDDGRGREDDVPPDRKRHRRDRDADDRNGYSSGSANGHANKGSGTNGSGRGQKSSEASEPNASWLRANIRVRVVHKSYAGGRAYLGKGRVVDVPRVRQATVRMDLGDLVLEGVKERHLETVLPARGGKVIVVRGPEKAAAGKLLAKNKEKETAMVQVYEDLRVVTLSLDDVAEFTGMLDEDMDDVGY